jgi:dihydropteroate synthase
MNARYLSAADPGALATRFGRSLAAEAIHRLADAGEACILAIDGAAPEALTPLRAAGAGVVQAGSTLLVGATRGQLNVALRDAPPSARPIVATLLDVMNRAQTLPATLQLRDRTLDTRDEACVMGIVNVTPDSFYERVGTLDEVVAKTRAMVQMGAALVDVGGQSYAHWNARIAAEEERARVVPAVRAIIENDIDVAISVDTFKASVADAALAAGAHLINDCSGLSDPDLPAIVAKYGAGLVVMHIKGELMVRDPSAYVYSDALAEIIEFLHERTERAIAAGVSRDAIAIDPGLEFGKEPQTDLEILERFAELRALGFPILFASSRKSFIGRIFDRPAKELLVPSLATAAIGISAGARILRVHDVEETVQLARMMAAVAPERRARLAIAMRMPGTPAAGGNSRSG